MDTQHSFFFNDLPSRELTHSTLGKRKIILQNTFGKRQMLFPRRVPLPSARVLFFFPPFALRIQIPPNRVGLMVSITSPCYMLQDWIGEIPVLGYIGYIPSRKLTWQHKITMRNRRYIFIYGCFFPFSCQFSGVFHEDIILELYHILYHYHVCFRICSEGDPMLLSFWMGFSNPSRCVIQVLLLS